MFVSLTHNFSEPMLASLESNSRSWQKVIRLHSKEQIWLFRMSFKLTYVCCVSSLKYPESRLGEFDVGFCEWFFQCSLGEYVLQER